MNSGHTLVPWKRALIIRERCRTREDRRRIVFASTGQHHTSPPFLNDRIATHTRDTPLVVVLFDPSPVATAPLTTHCLAGFLPAAPGDEQLVRCPIQDAIRLLGRRKKGE